MDEVLYYLAYEYEQAQDYKNARTVYYELIQKAPQSKYIPNAYLAFGELFFNEAQGDPIASGISPRSAYKEVIKYPPPNNKVYGYAHYKLAYVYWNKGEFPRALDEFKKTIDYGVQFASIPERRAARHRSASRSRAGLRALGPPRRSVQLLQEPLGRQRWREHQDAQDDGRPRVTTTSTPVTTPRPSRSTTTSWPR